MADNDCADEVDDGQCRLWIEEDDCRCPEPQEPGTPFCAGHNAKLEPMMLAYIASLN